MFSFSSLLRGAFFTLERERSSPSTSGLSFQQHPSVFEGGDGPHQQGGGMVFDKQGFIAYVYSSLDHGATPREAGVKIDLNDEKE
jgi:hypothetical protein